MVSLDVTAEQAKTAVIAYEPIWAIGTGKTATTEQAQEVCKGIRECIAEIYDEATAEAIRIQYGGSVNAGNRSGAVRTAGYRWRTGWRSCSETRFRKDRKLEISH